MSLRRRSLIAAALGVASLANGAKAQGLTDAELDVWHVRGGIYMVVGAGGNTTVQVGDDGVLVVDTKLVGAEDRLLEAIAEISGKPIRYVINTHSTVGFVTRRMSSSIATWSRSFAIGFRAWSTWACRCTR